MRVCIFTYQETHVFSELWRFKRANAWLLAVSYVRKCTLFNDALVWIRPQFSSFQRTDFFILQQGMSQKIAFIISDATKICHRRLVTSCFAMVQICCTVLLFTLPNDGREKWKVREPLARTTRSIFLVGLAG
jgi:hypothetical protein